MPFDTSENPKKWQELYLEKTAHFDSLRKVSAILLPSLFMIIFPLLFLIFFAGRIIEYLSNTYIPIGITIGVAILLILIPLFFTGFGVMYLFKSATTFLEHFHNLSTNVKAKEIASLKIMGKPGFPPPLSNLFKFGEVTVKDGKLDPPDHWSSIIGGPVRLKIQPGNALYIERGTKFSRIVGQGQAFLHWDERIATAINVGPKYEKFKSTAWTKDGIKLEIEGIGEYFLGRERQEGDENILIPYDPESIRKAAEFTFKNGKDANEWIQSAKGNTIGALNSLIANKYLDELFVESRHESPLLSTKNMQELLEKIKSKLMEYGVTLSSLQITSIKPPAHVNQERMRTWEVERKNLSTIATGEVKAHQIRMREKARAEMQRDLIIAIANSLENIDAENFPEPLLLTLSNYLDHSLESPQVRANIAKESLELLEKMQEILKFPLWMTSDDEDGKNKTEDVKK